MEKRYDNIVFSSFLIEPEDKLSEKENMKIKSKFRESIRNIDKSAIENNTYTSSRFRRRSVVIAAAMVLVLSLGAVVYATDMFGLGILKDPQNNALEYESVMLEDSNQYKATLEYYDYMNGLPESELSKILRSSFEGGGNKGIIGITSFKSNEVLDKIIAKYNLRFTKKSFEVDSAQAAIKSSGLIGFSDKFLEKYDNGDGAYFYTDTGELYMFNLRLPDSWQFECYPTDVFIDGSHFSYIDDDIDKNSIVEYSYKTQDGHSARINSFKFKDSGGTHDEVDDGVDTMRITLRYYQAVVITDSYIFKFGYEKLPTDGKEMSNKEFESLLEEFDYSKID